MQLGRVNSSAQDLKLVLSCCKCMQCCVSLPAPYQGGAAAAVTCLANQLGVPDVADVTVPWSNILVLSVSLFFHFLCFWVGEQIRSECFFVLSFSLFLGGRAHTCNEVPAWSVYYGTG